VTARVRADIDAHLARLGKEGVLNRSPVTHVRRPRVSQESPTLGLNRAELRRFLAAASGQPPGDRALVCLLALNGLRISQAGGADVQNLGRERRHRTLSVSRKRGGRAVLPLAQPTIDAVEAHIAGRSHDARRILRRLARTAGMDKPLSPHSRRHSFVTLSLEAGVPLHWVQDTARHAAPRTTRRFDPARHALEGHGSYALAAFVETT
jgi:integrase/recombinase XerD